MEVVSDDTRSYPSTSVPSPPDSEKSETQVEPTPGTSTDPRPGTSTSTDPESRTFTDPKPGISTETIIISTAKPEEKIQEHGVLPYSGRLNGLRETSRITNYLERRQFLKSVGTHLEEQLAAIHGYMRMQGIPSSRPGQTSMQMRKL